MTKKGASLIEADNIIDVAIVGAGPAGLSAALYCARGGLRTVIFGDPYESQLAKAGVVENFLTWRKPGTQGLEISEAMLMHALDWEAVLVEKEIRKITKEKRHGKDVFKLVDVAGDETHAYTVILCSGTKYRKLGVRGEDDYYAKGVGYCTICEGPLFKEQAVAIVGFGDEAIQAALRMATIASSLSFLSTKPKFGKADVELIRQLKDTENITIYENVRPLEIIGNGKEVTGFKFKHDNEIKTVTVKAVFIEVGTLPSSAIASELGVALDGQFVQVDRNQETNVPGFHAAGDITGGIARQAIVSAGDGARAAIHAIDYIKKQGLSQSKLRTTQWGSVKRAEQSLPRQEVKQRTESTRHENLIDYIMSDEGFYHRYEQYRPLEEFIGPLKTVLPKAEVIMVTAHWCPDCRRNVPKMARIAEHLPEWTFKLADRDEEGVAEKYGVRKIPTFIIKDPSGKELGRIIESPKFGSLEQDLLAIARGEHDREIERNPLHDYVNTEKEFQARYERYQPELPIIRKIHQTLPKARVVAVNCRHSRECIRYIPRLARISEHLPEWDFIVFDHNTPDVAKRYQVKGLPTFIVFAPDGTELGRIAGKPISESIEQDLLNIVNSTSN